MADITIIEGDTLEVDYNLENTGDRTGTFDPRLLVEGVQEDQDTGITLDPAQTATGTLQWPTESGDAVTDALVEAVTDDTSDSIIVTVNQIPDSDVTQIFTDNIDTYWRMNEGSGTSVDDVIDSQPATLTNAGWGNSGLATVYNQSDDYLTSDNSFWINDTNVSLGYWIKISDEGGEWHYQANPNSTPGFVTNGGFTIRTGSFNIDEIRIEHGGGGGTTLPTSVGNIPLNEWIFVALSFNGDTSNLYVWDRSQQIGTDTGTATRDTGDAYLHGLGPSYGRTPINGSVALVVASQTTLTEQTWADIWNETNSV